MKIYRITRLHTYSEHVYVYAPTQTDAVDYVWEKPEKVKWRLCKDKSIAIIHRMEIQKAQLSLRLEKDIDVEYLDGTRVKLEDFFDEIAS